MTLERDAGADRSRSLFERSPDVIVVVDGSGAVIDANARIEDLLGYEPAELLGEPIEVLVPEQRRDEHRSVRDAYLDDPERRPMGAGLDLEARHKDGTMVPVDISLSPVATDPIEVMAVVRDIREHETLRRKYRTLLETTPDAIFVGEVETGDIIEVNQQAVELLGYSREELLDMNQFELHPSGEGDRYRELFEYHVSEGPTMVTRFQDGSDILVETKDGDHVPVEINGQVTDLDGRRVIIGVFRDISTRRTYERRLERQIDQLKSLAQIISHDVRNPLNVAVSTIDVVREDGDLDKLDRVIEAHERIDTIIDDMLTLVREEENVDTREPLELDAIARDCWRTVDTKAATLQVDTQLVVRANPHRVRHLFENLFDNAVEHGGESVTVRIGGLEEGFYVEDDGPGIPDEERDDVFDAGHTSQPDGTGLGLNIIEKVADAHGWEITVTDGTDGGARFEIRGMDARSPG